MFSLSRHCFLFKVLEFCDFYIFKNYYEVAELFYCLGEKLYEIKILEETHKQEVSRLQKRLQWYAENQELLDKDAARLREANEEAEKLKLEVPLCMSPLARLSLLCHSVTAPLCLCFVACTGDESRALNLLCHGTTPLALKPLLLKPEFIASLAFGLSSDD